MAKVLLVLATVATALPANQAFGGSYLFKIGDGNAQIVPATQAEFDGVADGSYTASCQALDATGAPMGPVVTCDFAVATPSGAPAPGPAPAPSPSPDTTYPAPSGLAASVTY